MRDTQNQPQIRPAFIGSGPAPTIQAGNGTQLGTGPSASLSGTAAGLEVTLTTGTVPAAFVANTPVVLATITLPAGLFQAAPFVSLDATNQALAQLEAGGLTAATQALCIYYDRAASSATSIVIKAVSQGTPTLGASTAYKFELGIVG